MAGQIVIAGYSSTDKVPGFYGETLYGQGAQSASSLPLVLLLAGQKKGTSGSAVVDQDITLIQSAADADTYWGAGGPLARMAYAALRTPNVVIYGAPIANANGAAAAVLTVTMGGSYTTSGTFTYRIAGETSSFTVATTDTTANVATNLAADINAHPRWPVTASAGGGGGLVVTVTHKALGDYGNSEIYYQDLTKAPAGLTATIAGGTPITGGGVPMHNGSGTVDPANVIALIASTQYDRIATQTNDATAIGKWKTQVDAQAGPLVGILGQVVFASNGSLASLTSIAQTTCNDQRFQALWALNSETHPAEIAATFASMRASAEQSNPAASYDDAVLPGVFPNSNAADQPTHATLVSALNNSVTPIYWSGGAARIVRSICTHSLNGSSPDYSTLDTSDVTVPDFVRADLKVYWVTSFRPNNQYVQDDPADNAPSPPTGVAYPKLWTAAVTGKMRDYEQGKSLPNPIVINVSSNLPVSTYDKTAKRIMSAVNVVPIPVNHSTGVSVRQQVA